jgi:hypothetical protein
MPLGRLRDSEVEDGAEGRGLRDSRAAALATGFIDAGARYSPIRGGTIHLRSVGKSGLVSRGGVGGTA